jgi:hypothetical protein
VAHPLVIALLSDPAVAAALAAGFEEEGVPVTVAAADGDAEALARAAAREALLGIGIGGDAERLALVLTGATARPYLSGPTAEARAFGRDGARIAARRPIGCDRWR